MEETAIKNLAKKIQRVNTFQELHDLIMEYAKDEEVDAEEFDFVEFPESKYQPTGGKQEHEKKSEYTVKHKLDDLRAEYKKHRFEELEAVNTLARDTEDFINLSEDKRQFLYEGLLSRQTYLQKYFKDL